MTTLYYVQNILVKHSLHLFRDVIIRKTAVLVIMKNVTLLLGNMNLISIESYMLACIL